MNGQMTEFKKSSLNLPNKSDWQKQMADLGLTKKQGLEHRRQLLSEEVWVNDQYQVNIDKSPNHGFSGMSVWHLSIKRHDKEPVHDWRDLQEIKNRLVAKEAEAIELYPAESRLVDSANQFHLWVFLPDDDSTEYPKVPLGWFGRLVTDDAGTNAKQRKRSKS